MHRVFQQKLTEVRHLTTAIALSVVILAIGGCSLPEQMSSGSGSQSSGGGSPGGESPDGESSGGESSGGESSGDSSGEDPRAESSDKNSASEGQSVDDLDAQLDDSLDDFDSRVGGAGDDTSVDVLDPMGSGPTTLDSSQPVFEELDMDSDSVAERAEEEPDNAQASAESDAVDAESNSTVVPLPDDIGDGRGDDAVLRQVRELAERETDPVKREKLWAYYRRLKGQD